MGAEYSFYMKSIETNARAFLALIILPIGTVSSLMMTLFSEKCLVISNLTEERQVSRWASDRGSYAKPLFVRALSSHSRVRESELSS